MSKRMTIVFHNEKLYTALKMEAARRHQPVSELVAQAVQEWLECQEDETWLPLIEAARAEWRTQQGRPWEVVEKELEAAIRQREGAETSGVPD